MAGARRPSSGVGSAGAGWRVDEDEPRVVGLPLRWFSGASTTELRGLRHPVAYLRWRRERRRLGPYARSLDEILSGEDARSA